MVSEVWNHIERKTVNHIWIAIKQHHCNFLHQLSPCLRTLLTLWVVFVLLEVSQASPERDLFLRSLQVSGVSNTQCPLSSFLTDTQSVGLLYLWSASQIRKGAPNGLEGAIGKHANPLCELNEVNNSL